MGYTTVSHVYQLYLPWLIARDHVTGLQLRGSQLQPSRYGHVRAKPVARVIAHRFQLHSMWIGRGVLL